MSHPADQDAPQIYYSYRVVKGGGGRARGAGERVRWVGERATLVVVTQCLLLPTRTHHSYTTHTVSLRGGGGGGGARGAGERVRWVGERAILVVVTQCLLLLTRTHVFVIRLSFRDTRILSSTQIGVIIAPNNENKIIWHFKRLILS